MLPLATIFLILKLKEYPLRILKYFFLSFLIIDILFSIINFENLFPPYNETSFFIAFSHFALTLSIALFALSYALAFKDLIELKAPSRYESRKGKIIIGRVMKKKRKLYKFFLSLKDLERHMFVCGTTGSVRVILSKIFLLTLRNILKYPSY